MKLHAPRFAVRCATPADVDDVRRVDSAANESPETAPRWRRRLSNPLTVAWLPEGGYGPAGYLYAVLAADGVEVKGLAVSPAWRGCGVATALLRRLFSEHDAERVWGEVPDSLLPTHKLLRKLGVPCVGTKGADKDVYVFERLAYQRVG